MTADALYVIGGRFYLPDAKWRTVTLSLVMLAERWQQEM